MVGIFDAGGSAFDSEIWCDHTVLAQTFDRSTNVYSSMTVRLNSPTDFEAFKDTLTSDPRLTVQVEREAEYYERQSEGGAYSLSARAIAFHELGDESARDAALAELMEIDERRAALQVAKVQAWMGNTDEAFRWLDRYLDPDSPVYIREFTGILWDPILRSLWNDPRWLELRRQANLGPERFEKVRIRMP